MVIMNIEKIQWSKHVKKNKNHTTRIHERNITKKRTGNNHSSIRVVEWGIRALE